MKLFVILVLNNFEIRDYLDPVIYFFYRQFSRAYFSICLYAKVKKRVHCEVAWS